MSRTFWLWVFGLAAAGFFYAIRRMFYEMRPRPAPEPEPEHELGVCASRACPVCRVWRNGRLVNPPDPLQIFDPNLEAWKTAPLEPDVIVQAAAYLNGLHVLLLSNGQQWKGLGAAESGSGESSWLRLDESCHIATEEEAALIDTALREFVEAGGTYHFDERQNLPGGVDAARARRMAASDD